MLSKSLPSSFAIRVRAPHLDAPLRIRPRSVRELMENVRKLCKIWTFGEESSKAEIGLKSLFLQGFWCENEVKKFVPDLTFGTEGWALLLEQLIWILFVVRDLRFQRLRT